MPDETLAERVARRRREEPLYAAVLDLEDAVELLRDMADRKTYTIKEIQEVRRQVLDAVRNGIDPYALGHAPDKRHY